MADLLLSLFYTVGGAFLGLLMIYLIFRVGALAVLKSIDEYRRNHRITGKEESSHGVHISR